MTIRADLKSSTVIPECICIDDFIESIADDLIISPSDLEPTTLESYDEWFDKMQREEALINEIQHHFSSQWRNPISTIRRMTP